MYSVFPASRHDLSSLSNEFNSSFCVADFRGTTRNFSANLRGARTGSLSVFRYDGHGLSGGVRSLRHIRTNPADDFVVLLPLNFSHRIVQFGNRDVITPGSFALLSTVKPFESYCGEPPHHYLSELVVKVPGPLLRKRIPLIDQCCGISFPAQQGMGRIMQSIIESILDEGNHLSPPQAEGLGTILLDTMCLAAQESPALASLQSLMALDTHSQVRQKAQAFIESRLSDSNLDIAMVADHCGVSRGHLHVVFAESPLTVGGYIREMRLQRCRDDLMNPALRNQSIIQIGMRWGFTNSVSFSRAYSTRFGVPPREERGVSGQRV